jgi:hypothetical protein
MRIQEQCKIFPELAFHPTSHLTKAIGGEVGQRGALRRHLNAWESGQAHRWSLKSTYINSKMRPKFFKVSKFFVQEMFK